MTRDDLKEYSSLTEGDLLFFIIGNKAKVGIVKSIEKKSEDGEVWEECTILGSVDPDDGIRNEHCFTIAEMFGCWNPQFEIKRKISANDLTRPL